MKLIFFFFFALVCRCVQLIEPSLSTTEAKYVERLITIYMDENPIINAKIDEDTIHTLDEFLEKNQMEKLISTENHIQSSIWKEAPGW